MTAAGSRVAVASALASMERRLLRSVEADPPDRALDPAPQGPRPVVAVIGLRRGCGATTLARALAAELANRDPAQAAAVCGPAPSGPPPLRSVAAARLARTLSAVAPGRSRAAGRLCLVDTEQLLALTAAAMDVAPLVLEVRAGAPPAAVVSLADHVVMVAPGGLEPSLAAVVAASLARVGPEPVCVVNRVHDPGPWAGRPAVLVPETRLGARLAGAGHGTRGVFGPALAELADRCEAPACD